MEGVQILDWTLRLWNYQCIDGGRHCICMNLFNDREVREKRKDPGLILKPCRTLENLNVSPLLLKLWSVDQQPLRHRRLLEMQGFMP